MKYAITLLACVVGYTASAMSSLPNGTYEGKGVWRTEKGQKGEYTMKVTFKDNHMEEMLMVDGKTFEVKADAKFDGNDFFVVSIAGAPSSRGYCGSVWCHAEGKDFEETMAFVENHLYQLGSKTADGVKLVWEGDLEKK